MSLCIISHKLWNPQVLSDTSHYDLVPWKQSYSGFLSNLIFQAKNQMHMQDIKIRVHCVS